MLKLYGYWRSTAAYRVRIALNVKQVSYSSVSVHLVKDGGEQHKAEYRTLNPQGLVPLLVDGKNSINQSPAILEYLEERYPTPALLPEDLYARAEVRSICQMVACDIHPLNNLRVLQYLTGELDVTEERKSQWYHHWIHKGFEPLETKLQRHMSEGPYCMGSNLTMADIYLVSQVYNANRFNVDLKAYPRICAINEHCMTLSAFADAAPENQQDAISSN